MQNVNSQESLLFSRGGAQTFWDPPYSLLCLNCQIHQGYVKTHKVHINSLSQSCLWTARTEITWVY